MIENLLLDGAMLILTLLLMRKRVCFGRVLIASLLGALTSTLMLIVGMQFGIAYIVILFGMGMVMMRLAMKQKTWHEVILGIVYYFTLVFAFSKLHQVSEWIMGNRVSGIVLVAFVIGIMSVALLYMIYQNRKGRQRVIYSVAVIAQGKSVEVKALLDTGNSLMEPFTRKPVSIIESEAWRNVLPELEPERFKVIPFHSIGQEHGILKGMEIDELIIWAGDRKIVQKQAIIAVYEGSLSSDKSYQMILHQGLLV
ncbi:MAG: sigma-E processing peptidase SpoIIGA [Lachnospiraceae bacterium]|nr:sigma-E processing peptidase SpoIIGA [Lachnospiraceae bacterium]